ncbi:MAG: hypothetical protein WKH68_06455, partial [Candidatus Limnocylindria bacterium]
MNPWLPGRRTAPRRRTRQEPARRTRRHSADRRAPSRIDVRALLVAIVVAAGLALFYLSQSTRVAATGY